MANKQINEEILTKLVEDNRIYKIKSPFCSCGKQMSDNWEITLNGTFTANEIIALAKIFEGENELQTQTIEQR